VAGSRSPGGVCLHRAVPVVLNGFDLDLPAAHGDGRVTAEAATIWKLLTLWWVPKRIG
jgi:hypothetical protein